MSNDLTEHNGTGIPAHLAQYQKKSKIGNVDSSDMIIPRIKLLQAISPELQTFNNAKAGVFWHTTANEPLGSTLMGIPIVIRKSYILWAPRNDDRMILARAMDGEHWDVPLAEFTVKPKGSANSVTYYTKGSVAESGLAEFGSSVPGDPQSVPAASLTYNMLWYFPEFPELSPAVIINTRSGVKPMQELLTKIQGGKTEHFVQQYNIQVVQMKGAEGPYFSYNYAGAGFADAHTAEITSGLFRRYADAAWVANDEESDSAESSKPKDRRQVNEEMASKF